jgi:MFS family permease
MRNILTVFLVSSLLLDLPAADRAGAAKDVFHTFVIGVYFFPLLGGWIADRFFGKYHTIFWLSLLYCLGHLCLAVFESHRPGFYAGLFLIALGSGGIKPCVSAFVGDQFDQTNKARAKVVFDAFYWIINFGSFFAPSASPASSWGLATFSFWLGRKKFVHVPPHPGGRFGLLDVLAGSALFMGVFGYPVFLRDLTSLPVTIGICVGLVVLFAAALRLPPDGSPSTTAFLTQSMLSMWARLTRAKPQEPGSRPPSRRPPTSATTGSTAPRPAASATTPPKAPSPSGASSASSSSSASSGRSSTSTRRPGSRRPSR